MALVWETRVTKHAEPFVASTKSEDLPYEVYVDGYVDLTNNMTYIGTAKRHPTLENPYEYRALANVCGALCLVAITLRTVDDIVVQATEKALVKGGDDEERRELAQAGLRKKGE